MRVKFIKNPAGRYNLAYEIGEEVNVPDSQGLDMLADGYAILAQPKPQNASSKQVKETR